MIENFYPNPIVVQRLQAGPLSTHIDTFAQQLFDEGYALWTAKYAVRLLADLTIWMQQQGLTVTDLAEQPVNTFFQHRYQIRRPHRDDRAILKKLLAHLRVVGVIAAPVKAVADPAYTSIVQAFQQYLVASAIWHLRSSILISTRWYIFLASALEYSRRIWMRCARKTSPALCCSRHVVIVQAKPS
ncbi:MAG: hypothetical protein PHY54_12480 [Methylococcales bacterium]|nr:hypothetical protein [Methylococcales bacterium]